MNNVIGNISSWLFSLSNLSVTARSLNPDNPFTEWALFLSYLQNEQEQIILAQYISQPLVYSIKQQLVHLTYGWSKKQNHLYLDRESTQNAIIRQASIMQPK